MKVLVAFLITLFAEGTLFAADPVPGPQSSASSLGASSASKKYRKSRLTRDESEAIADRRRLLLSTGEDKAVDIDFDIASANGITIGNPALLAATLIKLPGEKRQIVFKPLKDGATNVTLRDSEGAIRLIFNVRIAKSNLLRIAGEIRDLLRDVEGLDIRVVGQKVIIEGELLTPADYGKLGTVVGDKDYSGYVINLTSLSPLAVAALAKRIQEDINNFAPNVRTRVVNGLIFLEGTVDTLEQAQRAGKVALLYLPETRPGELLEAVGKPLPDVKRQLKPRDFIQNFIVINPPPPKKQEKLVRVTVHFVELAKDYNKLFGFKWQPGFTSDPQIAIGTSPAGGAAASGTSFSATISSLIPKLKSAQNAGYVRVLKTGTLIVRSGQPATLIEQTEFPFTFAGPNGQITAGKSPIGLEVGVTPLVLGQSEDIQMEIKMNQIGLAGRAPDPGTAPVTSTHRIETRIYVKSNESAAVAGVTSSDIGTDFNKDDAKPGGFSENTEPLFSLFRSKAYRKKKSQFVIFVTPQIIENASEGTEDLKRNFRVKVK